MGQAVHFMVAGKDEGGGGRERGRREDSVFFLKLLQFVFRLMRLLPQPPKYRNYRCISADMVNNQFLIHL